MNIRIIFSFLFLTISHLLFGQSAALSERVANYEMDIIFDDQEKTLEGNQKITWRNTSTDTVASLQFHLYYNAFKNNRSTFYQETGRSDLLKSIKTDDCHWGYSEVKSIRVNDGDDQIKDWRYIQPDDQNMDDQTVGEIILSSPVLPGESAVIHMTWKAKIPKIKVRTGYNKDFYFFAQWFPKLGRYETANSCNDNQGQWKCHQYHASGEYYADFGNYKVSITAPQNFVLGGSGELIEKKESGNTTVWTYQVDDVIDFAWAASPHFSVQTDRWKDVDLALITYPGHEHCGGRYFGAVKNALEYLTEHLGEYPYSTLTIIDPPIHGIFTGGMEYPTLITSLSFCFLPEGVMTTETLTTHEFIHQYFMQMVATNEQEEPWMDEGITTYYEGRIMDHYYGATSSTIKWMGMTVGNAEFNRWEYFASDNPKIADSSRKSREFVHGGYASISYNKTAVWLKTLEGLVGIETMDAIMKTYFDRWKFNHPCAGDFEDVVNEVVRNRHGDTFGDDMTWYFDQVLRGSNACDYKLASIKNDEIDKKEGYLLNTDTCDAEDVQGDDTLISSSVIVHRLGEVKLPVDIAIYFDDGTMKNETWDGIGRSKSYEYVGPQKITKAIIDPDRKIYLDKDFINNSLSVEKDDVGVRYFFTHFVEKIQSLMLGMSIFI